MPSASKMPVQTRHQCPRPITITIGEQLIPAVVTLSLCSVQLLPAQSHPRDIRLNTEKHDWPHPEKRVVLGVQAMATGQTPPGLRFPRQRRTTCTTYDVRRM